MQEREFRNYVADEAWSDIYPPKTLMVLTKEDLVKFNTRFLLSRKPYDLKNVDKEYMLFGTLGQFKLPQYCLVKADDFIEVLESRPHIPNKKEGKIIRKSRIKKGK